MSIMSGNDSSLPLLPAVVAESKVERTLAESTASSSQTREEIRRLTPLAEATVADRRYRRGATESASSRWGALELRRKIADGGFGTVYLAWDPALEREVALKVQPLNLVRAGAGEDLAPGRASHFGSRA
jgi:serine/threonine protein kinase